MISFKDIDGRQIGPLGLRDLSDNQFAAELARFSLTELGIPDNAIQFSHLDVLPLDNESFAVGTDIDFNQLGRFLPEASRKEFGQANLFVPLADIRFDLLIAATANAALVGNAKHQAFVNKVLQRTIGVAYNSELPKREIYDYLSVDTPSVREIINSGEKTTADFISLLERASSFRRWLDVQNPTSDLVKEMLREKTSEGWLQRAPAKVMRFGLFSLVGMAADSLAPGSSILTGAVDSFLLDRLSKKWRPHYFVENDLRSFLSTSDVTSPTS